MNFSLSNIVTMSAIGATVIFIGIHLYVNEIKAESLSKIGHATCQVQECETCETETVEVALRWSN